jgi:hypothetical protein
MQIWNFPQSRHVDLRFVIDTEAPNVQEKMMGFKAAWDMGLSIKSSDVFDVIGASMPGDKDEVVYNPQIMDQMLTMNDRVKAHRESKLEDALPTEYFKEQYK